MADAFFTCNTSSTGANARVQQQFDYLNTKTEALYDKTIDLVGMLGSLQMPTLALDVATPSVFDFHIEGYTPPPALDAVDTQALNSQFPGAPPAPAPLPDIDTGDVPVAPPSPPTPSFPPAPSVYSPQFAPPPDLDFAPVPQYGDYTGSILPPVPRAVDLPVAPNVDLDSIVFDGTRPVFNGIAPDPKDFAYVEPDYVPEITPAVKAAIQSMLNGTSGLPTAVENALWARQAQREDEQALRAEEDAIDAWAAKGHGLPGGVINKQLQQIRQNNQNQRNSLGREVMIRTHEVLIDQLKFAVAQGLAYEDLFIRLFNEVQNRKLQAARFAIDIAISVYNALVGQFQAEAAIYKTDADVYLARLQGALAKLQVYREQLHAAEIIQSLNETDVKIYLARLQAIETNIRVYVASIQARNSILEGNTQKLAQAKLLIDEQLAKLNASEIESRIWLGELQGQQTIQSAYATRAQVFLGETQAYEARNRVQIEKLRLQIADEDAISNRYRAVVDGFTALATYIRARAELIVQNNQTRIQGYAAETAGKSSYNSAVIQKMQNIMQDMIEVTNIKLKNGEINVQNILEAHKLIQQKFTTLSEVLAGMAESFASATHVGAQISDSSSVGSDCNFTTSQTIG